MKCGVPGEFLFWTMHHLHEFDLSNDLVLDVMNICDLNIFKSCIYKFFEWIAKHEDEDME
jgi:hypothetical protein